MATIREIAKIAGVSPATVSRVLNKDEKLKVSDVTREKIVKIANELNYVVKEKQVPASSMKLGLYYWYSSDQEINDTYYMIIRQGIETECQNKKINLTKVNEGEVEHYDGIIALGKFSDEEIKTLSTRNNNIVFVDYAPDDMRFDAIVADYEGAVDKALNLFVERAYESIGFIGGREPSVEQCYAIDEREIAFRKLVKDYHEKDIYIGRFSTDEGYRMMHEAIEKGDVPRCFFIANDALAIGAIKALSENEIRIPEEVAVISFNDDINSAYVIPPLTTLRVKKVEMGIMAVRQLVEKITNQRDFPVKLVLPTELIIRESC